MRVTVERLGHLGDGIAGGLYLPGLLPGEVAEVTGETVRIVTPSPDRVRPPCPHARACGGCALQHARDGFVAAWKAGVVRTALAAQGIEAPLAAVVTSPPRSRRRATLAARRTKGGVTVGFHRRGSDQIVPVPGCILLSPALMAALPAVEEIARIGASRSAGLDVTLTATLAGVDVAVTGGKPLDAALTSALAAVADARGLPRIAWDGVVAVQRAQPVVAFGAARVPLPPGAFLQATAEGEAALVTLVRRAVGGARRLADLFAGCGTFALPLAETAEVHAAEGDRAMIAALLAGARTATGLCRVTAEARDLFRRPLEGEDLKGFDAAVIDPPRAGAEAQTAALAAARLPVIAAVSCNPATFARDARILVDGGYLLDWVAPVDQFRWSTHVELAARFRLPHIAPQLPPAAPQDGPDHDDPRTTGRLA
jgi:23S rRNA (uracil1939-C5)-methyltransferase